MEELIGKTLGQYEIREKIGEGGMAEVFKAYQPSLNRFVAVKILAPAVAEKKGFTERFQREARSVARLNHPNILAVHDFGFHEGYNYLVMRYVEHSRTLGDLIEEGAPLDRLIDYILQVADALNYAHEQGIIHRDVKPSNILIDGKWALLSDFGLVKMSESVTHLTISGHTLGTPAYMSPEQVEGIHVDHRTDIYALGIILYRILTGTIPHEAPTPIGMLVKRRTEPVPPPRRIKPNIPKSLEQVTLRSLAMKPENRYSSATHFAEALKKAQTDSSQREKFKGVDQAKENLASAGDATVPHLSAVAPRQYHGLIIGGVTAAMVVIGMVVFALLSLRGGSDNSGVQLTPQFTTSANAGIPAVTVETVASTPPIATLTPIPPSLPLAIAQTNLEIRSGPGDVYDLLGHLPAGTMAEITGRDETDQWWQIRTGLSAVGVGWIKAGTAFTKATGAHNITVAMAPPTPTGTATPVLDTPTPTVTPMPNSPTPTVTSMPNSPTPTVTSMPNSPTSSATSTPPPTSTPNPVRFTATPTPPAESVTTEAQPKPTAIQSPPGPAGQFTLIKPTLDDTSTGPTEFEWRWGGSVGTDQGFEIRVWREGEPPAGAHNAVEDNKNGQIAAVGNNTYRTTINIKDAAGVKGRGGDYLWTVVLIQVSPAYKDLGIQAPSGRLRLGLGGGGGSGGGGGPTF